MKTAIEDRGPAQMQAKQLVGISAVVLVVAFISGCMADGDAQAALTQPVTAVPLADESVEDSTICTGYGDVLTILENADLGLEEGRMEAQEHTGWYRLATRVLDRIPSSGDSAVAVAIADLQKIAPAIPSGVGMDPAGVRSSQWYAAMGDLGIACEDLGVPLAIDVFTGG